MCFLMEVHGPFHEVFIVAPKLNSEEIRTKRNMLNVFMRFSQLKLCRAVTSFLQQVKKNRVEQQKQQKWLGSEVNLQIETEETELPFSLQETCLYSDSNRPKKKSATIGRIWTLTAYLMYLGIVKIF